MNQPVTEDAQFERLLVGVVLGVLLADKSFRKRFDPSLMPNSKYEIAAREIILGGEYPKLRDLLRRCRVEWAGASDGTPLRAILERLRDNAAGQAVADARHRAREEPDWKLAIDIYRSAVAKADAVIGLDTDAMAGTEARNAND